MDYNKMSQSMALANAKQKEILRALGLGYRGENVIDRDGDIAVTEFGDQILMPRLSAEYTSNVLDITLPASMDDEPFIFLIKAYVDALNKHTYNLLLDSMRFAYGTLKRQNPPAKVLGRKLLEYFASIDTKPPRGGKPTREEYFEYTMVNGKITVQLIPNIIDIGSAIVSEMLESLMLSTMIPNSYEATIVNQTVGEVIIRLVNDMFETITWDADKGKRLSKIEPLKTSALYAQVTPTNRVDIIRLEEARVANKMYSSKSRGFMPKLYGDNVYEYPSPSTINKPSKYGITVGKGIPESKWYQDMKENILKDGISEEKRKLVETTSTASFRKKVIRNPVGISIDTSKIKKTEHSTEVGTDKAISFFNAVSTTYEVDGIEYDQYGKPLDSDELPFWVTHASEAAYYFVVAHNTIIAVTANHRPIRPDGTIADVRVTFTESANGPSLFLQSTIKGSVKIAFDELGGNTTLSTVPFARIRTVAIISDKYFGSDGICSRMRAYLGEYGKVEPHDFRYPSKVKAAAELVAIPIIQKFKELRIKGALLLPPASLEEVEYGKLNIRGGAEYASCTLEEYVDAFKVVKAIRIHDYITATLTLSCGMLGAGTYYTHEITNIQAAKQNPDGTYNVLLSNRHINALSAAEYSKLNTSYNNFVKYIPNYNGVLINVSQLYMEQLTKDNVFALNALLANRINVSYRHHDIANNEYADMQKYDYCEKSRLLAATHNNEMDILDTNYFDDDAELIISPISEIVPYGRFGELASTSISSDDSSLDAIFNGSETLGRVVSVSNKDVLAYHEDIGYANDYIYMEGAINTLPFASDVVKFTDYGEDSFVRYIPDNTLVEVDGTAGIYLCGDKLVLRTTYNGDIRYYVKVNPKDIIPVNTQYNELIQRQLVTNAGGVLVTSYVGNSSLEAIRCMDPYTSMSYVYNGEYLNSSNASMVGNNLSVSLTVGNVGGVLKDRLYSIINIRLLIAPTEECVPEIAEIYKRGESNDYVW